MSNIPVNFNSVNDLQLSDLPIGSLARTCFHTLSSEGGGALYEIIKSDDGFSPRTKFGFALIKEQTPDLRQFGAIPNDPTFDCLLAFENAQKYVLRGNIRITSSKGVDASTVYYVSKTVSVLHRRNFIGEGPAQTMIKSMAEFTGGVLVQIGGLDDRFVLNTSVRNIAINAANPGVVAGYSNSINENSGFFRARLLSNDVEALVINHADIGAGRGSAKNFNMRDLELYKYKGTGAVATIELNHNVACSINALTIIGGGFGTDHRSSVGLSIGDRTCFFGSNIHIEGAIDGLVGEGRETHLYLRNINGHGRKAGKVKHLIRRKAGSVSVDGVVKRYAEYSLRDDVTDTAYKDAVLDYKTGY